MRVLHVIPTLGPRYGGPSFACTELCGALAKRGADVSIYTTDIDRPLDWGGARDGVVTRNGVKIHFFQTFGPPYYWISPKLLQALRDNVPDFEVVHIHSLYRMHLPVSAYYCRKYDVHYNSRARV